jgi:hypothetical protein
MDERHDRSFRLLFSHSRMVRDLLRGFPPEGWVEWLDLATLERVDPPGSGIPPGRLGEVLIWRLSWQGGSSQVYLLLRHQTEAAPFMSLSMAVYQGLLCQELARHHGTASLAKPLPPVLPLVLHTGDEPWTAPLDAFDLFMPLPASLQIHVPRGRYSVLDLPHAPLPARAGAGNLVALLCELERSRSTEALGLAVDRLLALMEEPEQAELRRAWTDFLRDSLLPRRFPGLEIRLLLGDRRPAWNG